MQKTPLAEKKHEYYERTKKVYLSKMLCEFCGKSFCLMYFPKHVCKKITIGEHVFKNETKLSIDTLYRFVCMFINNDCQSILFDNVEITDGLIKYV